MNTLTSLLLLFFIGISIAAPVIYELDGSFEDVSFNKRAPAQEDEVTGWDVTGEFEVTGSSTGGDWTDESDGTTGDDGELDAGFTTTGNSPATSGSNAAATTGVNAAATTGKPAATTARIPASPTTGLRLTTGAVTQPGKKAVTMVGMIVDEESYTPENFQKGINKVMGLPEDEESIVITGTSKRSLTVNFYFIIAGAAEKALQLIALVESNDPALNNAGFTILGAQAEEVVIDDPATTGASPAASTTGTDANAIEDEDKGLSDGAIAGIVIGVIVVVVVVVGVAMFMLMRKKNKTTRVNPA